MTVIKSILDPSSVSLALFLDLKESLHFTISKLSFEDGRMSEKDLSTKSIHGVTGELSKVN